jgi:DNA-binding NarL/FixJ family response regulator
VRGDRGVTTDSAGGNDERSQAHGRLRTLQIAPATAVLVISMVDDDDSVFAVLAAGARGYVPKGATAAEITAALATVAAGSLSLPTGPVTGNAGPCDRPRLGGTAV